ncbi:4-hydroxybenzoyl-CoA thioesterase [Massilia sp. Root351]|jgi:4-hydroxybenzoyl-CoA thioesterase|uniref:acyl-CoA thioesterase n=1 Tax=Massilia sp. Root351 TaxID=1736522 RepID=UPI000710290C|nr:thioesterase family protein [Massilia sp. Root351]KQV86240.1 4-hydroxybenzoyl-CoA thioesterase [Massilia sp. Root351]
MDAKPEVSFEREVLVRFAHCDPAGIVFFPQYLVLFNGLVEDWFNEGLGIGYAHFIGARRCGLPIVKLDCEFKAPSKMGERLTLSLGVERVGSSSVALRLSASAGGQVRVVSRQVLVTTSLDTNKAISIPDDLRQLL